VLTHKLIFIKARLTLNLKGQTVGETGVSSEQAMFRWKVFLWELSACLQNLEEAFVF